MDKINKLLKELINVSLINEADVRILRRVVILAIFNSDIPNQMERDFKRRISSNPDPGVIKSNKKFLEQLLEDKAALVNDEKYLELKQDQKFQELSNSVNNKLTSLNKANDINFGNIAFTKPQLSKKFSYSTLLYYAAEGEVKNLENYLSRTYGPKFVFDLLRTKEMGSGSPETAQSGISDTVNELDLSAMVQSKHPAEDLDREIGTRLAKKYTYPPGYNEDFIENTITDIKPKDTKFNDPVYQENLDDTYNSLVRMNRTTLGGIKADTPQKKWDVVYGVISHFNPNDIKFYVETWTSGDTPEGKPYFDTIMDLEKKFDVPINWLPSPNSLYTIIDALDKKFNK
jgi:hypothetical protein